MKHILTLIWLASFYAFASLIRNAQPPDFEVNWTLAWSLFGLSCASCFIRFRRILSFMIFPPVEESRTVSGAVGEPRKRDRLDEILDYYGVSDTERAYGGTWSGNTLNYTLNNRGTLSIPFRWDEKTGRLEPDM